MTYRFLLLYVNATLSHISENKLYNNTSSKAVVFKIQ